MGSNKDAEVGRRLPTAAGPDDLRDSYSCLADDGAASERKREAAMLFSVAESHLDDEAHDEALSAASDALAIFRELDDSVGVGDAQRVVVHAHRGIADAALQQEDDRAAINALREADSIAREELQVFRDVGDVRGQASMLLSLAEVNYDQREGRKSLDALEAAEEALALFGEVSDPKMEALACLALSKARFEAKQVVAAKRAGNDAITLFKNLADKKREAAAWNTLASISAMDFCYEEAIRCERRRLKLATELGDKKTQACASHLIASWSLVKTDASAALASGSTALSLFRELAPSPALAGWEAASAALVADAHVLQNNPKKALESLRENLDRFRASGEKRQIVRMLHHLAFAHQADQDYDEAMFAAQEGLALCRELEARRSEAKMLETVAYIYIDQNNRQEAKKTAIESVEVLKDTVDVDSHEAYCKAHMFGLAKILVHIDDFPDAARACDDALRIAREVENRCLEGQAMLAICGAQAMNRNYEKAIKAGELAAEIFHEIGGNYRIDEAKSWQTTAEVHLAIGELSQALRSILQAEKLLQDFGDKRRLARMKHSRVRVHTGAGEHQEAVKVAMEALKISRSEDDHKGTVQSLFIVIEANVDLLSEGAGEGKPRRVFQQSCEKCLRFAKEAIAISMRTGDRTTEGSAYSWAAYMQIMLGRYADARSAAESAQGICKESGDKHGEAHATSLMAQAEMVKGDKAAALKLLSEAMAIAKEGKVDSLISEIADLQAHITGKQAPGPGQLAPLEPDDEGEPGAPPADAAAGGPSAGGAVDAYSAPDSLMVKSFIMAMVQNMTGGGEGEVDGDTPLMESGIDSLASVELRTQLQQEFKLNLPSTVMFNYPTITGLTDLLVDEMTNKKLAWSR